MTVKEVKIRSRLDCSYHVLVKFMISMNMGLAKSGVRILNFRRAKFQLIKYYWMRSAGKLYSGHKKEQSWQHFKDALLRAQEPSVPQYRKRGRGGRKPAWLGNDLLVKLSEKRDPS